MLGRECREADDRDCHVQQDDEADRAEQAPRQIAPRTAGLFGEVRDRLEPRVSEHRERERERDVVPGRRVAQRRPTRQRMRREEQREAEPDQQELGGEVDDCHVHGPAVEPGAMDEADHADSRDHTATRDDVPRAMDAREEGAGHVVRDEQRGECDHDQVVEEERPARDEPRQVVVGNAHERGSAAGLADRRRPLGVGQGDGQEERADEEQDERREAERVEGDDPKGEVDRRRDLPVGDRKQGGRIEDTLEARQLASHDGSLCRRPDANFGGAHRTGSEGPVSDTGPLRRGWPGTGCSCRRSESDASAAAQQHVQPPRAGCDEEEPDHVSQRSADDDGLDQQRDADPDEHDCERNRCRAVGPHAALLPAATMTRQGACLRTKSTVSLKIVCRGRPRRGAPITMICVPRRSASSTIARPALRARTIRLLTSTPYSSPIARASSST